MRRLLPITSLLGGLFWITLRVYPPECAQVTESSEVLCNRLWSPALLAILIGSVGLFLTLPPHMPRLAWDSYKILPVGFALMFLGNFVEYWMLTDLPHQGPGGWARGLAWMTVFVGLLVVMVAYAAAGIWGIKLGVVPRWLNVLFVLLFPLTLVTGLVNINWAGLPL